MTVAFDIRPTVSSPPSPLTTELAREEVRRGLVAMLRRRVPGQEVDDIAQTILCDALAAGTIPTDPEEIRRWLVGIARHKIADYHRGASRRNAREEGEAPLAACTAPPSAFEEREVLHRLLGAIESRRDAETMEWLVREHGGERLADIAAEIGLPAPVVWQRVSRLRRALRSRWASAVGVLVVLLGIAAAFGWSKTRMDEGPTPAVTPIVPERLVPDAPKPIPVPDAPILEDLQGNWNVQSVQPDRELTASEQKFVDTYSKLGTLFISSANVTLRTNNWNESWRVTSTAIEGEGDAKKTRLYLANKHGEKEEALVVVRKDPRGTRVEVRLDGHPRLAGKVILKRPVH